MPLYRSLMLALLAWAGLHPAAKAQGTKPKPHPAPANPYQAVDARMRQVPDSSARTVGGLARFINTSFTTEADRARAAFVWVARNIRYDVENMYLLEYERAPAVVIQETLDQRRGVCRHYAELYSAVANQAGVLTYVVPGYNSLLASVGHAWCASRIDGRWQLMEPTWAAGKVVNHKFVFELNNEYFRMPAKAAIELHMPFDPMWQLLSAPRTPQQFQQGTVPPVPNPAFAFADSVALYTQQTPKQRIHATNRRIAQNGVKNGLTYTYLVHNQNREDNLHFETYNQALGEYNAGIKQLNAFVEFHNHQFQPRKGDEELGQQLPPIRTHFEQARQLVTTVQSQNPSLLTGVREFNTALLEANDKLRKCQTFMDCYLTTNKLLRPTLFFGYNVLAERN
ncbi:transglutaminase domain-containing protein [Hymenobacter sp. B1770]|uniref:transglutaminase domain-containing protein n=1 Tax=Hymenobacter sp. B1770 TaxID=1718788 RepID=UPI003CF1EA71